MIRVMICEDVRDVREGLRYLLQMDNDIHVMAAAKNAKELYAAIQRSGAPDIVLMDIGLPGESGIEATKKIVAAWPQTKVLVLTIFEEEEKILSAIQAGASGYILKNTKPGELVSQIKALHDGGSPISPNSARFLLEEFQREKLSASCKDYRLTAREKEVMKDIMEGLTYREIADRHQIAASTVKKHILSIYRKMNVKSKVEFVKKAINLDLE
jgi:DNA-binding NarL/FixJ family response regulator